MAQQTSSLAITTILLSSDPLPTSVSDSWARNLSVNAKLNDNSTLLPSTCVLTSSYCSLAPNPQSTGASLDVNGLDDECLLWDDSCGGNRSFAISKFFGGVNNEMPTIVDLTKNVCFEDIEHYNCSSHNPPARLDKFKEIKSWMRSPKCFPAHDEYQAGYDAAHPAHGVYPDGQTGKRKRDLDGLPLQNSTTEKYGTCCGICNLEAENVDVYYWPDPAADDSCLGIIGDSILPPDHGATTDTELIQTYWGCTISAAVTEPDAVSILTTARLMITGSLSWKAYEPNPWSPLPTPCLNETKTLRPILSSSNSTKHTRGALYARGHSLVASTDQNGGPISTVVSGDFTFTSPSVYAYFHNLGASDSCGSTIFLSTLLSFPPDGLSTMVGPRYEFVASETRPFNFADVPCPPRSIAEENYYSPAPGEPYRPLIAVPSQVTEMVPWFKYCQDYFFTGYDPPRPLVALASMEPANWPSSAPQLTPAPAVEAAFDDNVPAAAPGSTFTAPGAQRTNDPGSASATPESGISFTESSSGSDTGNMAPVHPESRKSSAVLLDQATVTDLSTISTAIVANQANIDEQNEGLSSVSILTTMVAGYNIMKGPSNIVVDGIRISSDDVPITLSNMKAMRHQDKFILAQNIIQLSAPSPTIATSTQTIDGHIIEVAPKAVRVDGKPIQPGSAGNTENGISISLDTSEWLMLGTKSYHLLPPPSPTSSVAYTTILPDGAKALVLAQGGVSMAGTTIMPGAAEATISGTRISLDESYNLVFNGRVVTLPTDTTFSSRPANGYVPADQSSTPTTVADRPSRSTPDPANTFMALDRETTDARDTHIPVGSSSGQGPTPPSTITFSKASFLVPNSMLPPGLWLLCLLLYPPILLLS